MPNDQSTLNVSDEEYNSFIAHIEQLTNKRAFYKQALNILDSYARMKEKPTYISSLISDQFEVCKNIRSEIDAYVQDIFNSKYERDLKSHFSEKAQLDSTFFKLKHNIIDQGIQIENKLPINNENERELSGSIKLPPLQLPFFSGRLDEWLSFFESFKNAIVDNHTLNNIERLQYLKGALKHEALDVIRNLEITGDNFENAMQLLRDRYENKRLIINNHVRALFDIHSVIKENYLGIRSILDSCLQHIRSLSAIKRPTDQWDDLLIFLIVNKLPYNTHRDWEASIPENVIPTFKMLCEFLTHRCRTLSAIQADNNSTTKNNKINKYSNSKQVNCYVNTVNKFCLFCRNNNHYISQCNDFLNLSVVERYKFVTGKSLCVNCLRKGHTSNDCRSSKCRTCGKPHNSTLHREYENPNVNIIASDNNNLNSQYKTTTELSTPVLMAKSLPNVLLSTCIILVKDSNGKFHEARAILDSGSQINIITERLLEKLNLPLKNLNVSISGINEKMTLSNKMSELYFKSRFMNFSRKIDVVILDKICNNIPSTSINPKLIHVPQNVMLADECYYKSREVDLLIGSECFFQMLCVGQIRTNLSNVILQKSVMGWLLSGSINYNNFSNFTCALTNLDESLTRFWQIESLPERQHFTDEEVKCLNHFETTITRDKSGRFIATLPFSQSPEVLGSSSQIAKSRFINLENKLIKNSKLKVHYDNFINEYLKLGHMKCLGNFSEWENRNECACYLPHHPVYKESSLTTKVRVVFDASAKTNNNISLNDILMKGPVLQDNILDLLLRFRCYKYVLSGDISKMYRQILISNEQTKYQRILYRFSRDQSIKVFELLTLTYGTTPASFIATKCLQEISRFIESKDASLSNIIKNDFYMDDLLTGGDDAEALEHIVSDISALLSEFGFSMVKWCSNNSNILQNLNNPEEEYLKIEFNDNDKFKTLGLSWMPINDMIVYSHKFKECDSHITKRAVLSKISQIFDPLSLLAPFIIVAKLLMQEIWKLKLNWDECLPQNIHTRWSRFCGDLDCLSELKVPRNLKHESNSKFEIHAFADASEAAYGVSVYLREIKCNNEINVNLVCAKSRVAPLKKVSLPRLELCAALLLADFIPTVITNLRAVIEISTVKYYSDSTIVLNWINNTPGKWKTFVANRVAIIQEKTVICDWHHVRSESNPADMISRGCGLPQLIGNEFWWHGPKFLQFINYFPELFRQRDNVDIFPETKCLIVAHHSEVIGSDFIDKFIERFSKYTRMIRVFAYVIRFVNNCRRRVKFVGTLTVDELNNSETMLIKHVQLSNFSDELKPLKNNKQIGSNSKILPLTPFVDSGFILRVGGRIRHAKMSVDAKHPILLPKSSHFTKLIIRHFHVRSLHSGVQGTVAAIRTKFWILSARQTVRLLIRKCTVCLRSNPRFSEPILGDLPLARLMPSRPFSHSGIDFFGPLYVKEGSRKSRKIVKSYGCVFVCLATKAVHCEIVESLSSEAFIAALKRFVARRGMVSEILCDNGTNFVGAANELKQIISNIDKMQNNIAESMSNIGIKWCFNPPRAPHFGGIFEAAVKIFKRHIFKIAGNANLTIIELITLVTEIEGIMNSRPLVALSTDANDLEYLTPGHFLIGENLLSLPEEDLQGVKESRLSRWQRVQQLREHFWKRWYHDYIHELQSRNVWRKSRGEDISIGQVVIIKEDNVPSRCWRMGRVIKVHPGPDGIVRVATINTTNGEIRRPVLRLCVLETGK